jgi:N-acetylneuraminic acid mutarotase
LAGAQTTAPNEWTWVGGNNAFGGLCTLGYPCEEGQTSGNVGIYGTLGIGAAGNVPGNRSGASTWVDNAGNLWLFGGNGIDSANTLGELNDLWEFKPTTKEWTWMSGGSTIASSCFLSNGAYYYCGLPGVYGTLGTPAAGNVPAGRTAASSWTDSSGNFWLFGGVDSFSTALNDLWEYIPSSNEWAWMGGNIPPPTNCTTNCFLPPGVYGALGVPSASNMPAGRAYAAIWTDSSGNFWLYGGVGGDYSSTELDDLMEFNPSTNEWTWMGGSDPTSQNYDGSTTGTYGTLGVFAAGNLPGIRADAASWTDGSGNFWLFGGYLSFVEGPGIDSSVQNDQWEFSPSRNMWAWMGGQNGGSNCTPPGVSQSCSGNVGVYGTLGAPATGNIPGARTSASTWTDNDDHLWLFGGGDLQGPWNDLWVFEPSVNEWAWMGGTNPETATTYSFQPGVYGTLGAPAAGNVPGSRDAAATWVDHSGRLWLFSGDGAPNDLWVYEPPVSAATPAFSVAAGTYTSIQNVTMSDSTAGATIYYTTDGSAPSTSSTVYSAPIAVASTETLQAVAIATKVLSSAVASASYTINIPPDFSIAAAQASMTVTAGSSGATTVSVSPQGGFASAVTFTCSSGLPAGASCTFSPATVTPPGTTSTTVTVTTSAATAALHHKPSPNLPGTTLAIALCCLGWKKRRRAQILLLLAMSVAGLSLLNGCGGGGSSAPAPVTSTLTITATSGSLSHSTTFSLTVN